MWKSTASTSALISDCGAIMEKISVIVPVYKVAPYINRCLDSILSQTYPHFDLILVDDGSPDICGAVCDEYARKDRRVHVIHQENRGLSAARNAGIDWAFANSDSQWLTFVDSDDWVHSEMLERLVEAAKLHGTKISICGYAQTNGEQPEILPSDLQSVIWTPKDFYMRRFVNATVAWGKLYAKDCFEAQRYPLGKIHEDEFVTYRALFSQERLAVVSAPLYAYFMNPDGITRRKWSSRRLDAWEAYEEQITFFERLEDEELVKFRIREYLENALVNLQAAKKVNAAGEEISRIEKKIRRLIRKAWKRGCILFWVDYDMLYRFFPLKTRIYRLYLTVCEVEKKMSRKIFATVHNSQNMQAIAVNEGDCHEKK